MNEAVSRRGSISLRSGSRSRIRNVLANFGFTFTGNEVLSTCDKWFLNRFDVRFNESIMNSTKDILFIVKTIVIRF